MSAVVGYTAYENAGLDGNGLAVDGEDQFVRGVPVVDSRAVYAQSTVRRFVRWLDNKRINVCALYGPLIEQALADWGDYRLQLALDTSRLWGQYCIVRISVIYRGRAVPLVWTVLEHGSSSVAYSVYAPLLDAAAQLVPADCVVVFLAAGIDYTFAPFG